MGHVEPAIFTNNFDHLSFKTIMHTQGELIPFSGLMKELRCQNKPALKTHPPHMILPNQQMSKIKMSFT